MKQKEGGQGVIVYKGSNAFRGAVGKWDRQAVLVGIAGACSCGVSEEAAGRGLALGSKTPSTPLRRSTASRHCLHGAQAKHQPGPCLADNRYDWIRQAVAQVCETPCSALGWLVCGCARAKHGEYPGRRHRAHRSPVLSWQSLDSSWQYSSVLGILSSQYPAVLGIIQHHPPLPSSRTDCITQRCSMAAASSRGTRDVGAVVTSHSQVNAGHARM